MDAFAGCGDLVFSSHTIFFLLCALTFSKYCRKSTLNRFIYVMVVVFGALVVAARKHYSLDIFVAWYTVPLLWLAYERYYPDYVPAHLADPPQSCCTSTDPILV